MYGYDDYVESVCMCKLSDGRIVEYDMACSVDFYKENNVKVDETMYSFLGEGVVYSVDGIIQNRADDKTDYFWELKN